MKQKSILSLTLMILGLACLGLVFVIYNQLPAYVPVKITAIDVVADSSLTQYKNKEQGLSFFYPRVLKLSQPNDLQVKIYLTAEPAQTETDRYLLAYAWPKTGTKCVNENAPLNTYLEARRFNNRNFSFQSWESQAGQEFFWTRSYQTEANSRCYFLSSVSIFNRQPVDKSVIDLSEEYAILNSVELF